MSAASKKGGAENAGLVALTAGRGRVLQSTITLFFHALLHTQPRSQVLHVYYGGECSRRASPPTGYHHTVPAVYKWAIMPPRNPSGGQILHHRANVTAILGKNR